MGWVFNKMMETAHTGLQLFFNALDPLDWLVIFVNILLAIFARRLLSKFVSGTISQSALRFRTNLLRGLNTVILLVYAYQYIYLPAEAAGSHFTLVSILAILYLTYFCNSLAQYFIRKHYGKSRKIGDKPHYIETYQSRLLSIVAAVLLTLACLISIIHQLRFDSLLEAGGVLGIFGVMLGLTQASWAPDIISGLIILNSDMFEEGDIVDLSDGTIGRVYKTKLFHTEILNLSNNHRIMISNANLRNLTIHNLSKFASAKGLRESLFFKIGYDCKTEVIKKMFNEAYRYAVESSLLAENGADPEIRIHDTGDHAVEWAFIYHIKNVERIIAIRRGLKELIYNASLTHNISLATPLTHSRIT